MNILGFLNIIFVRIPIIVLLVALIKNKNRFVHLTIMIMWIINGALLMPQPLRHSHPDASIKTCFNNIRVISEAIDMYNIDKDQKMTSLDFPSLLEGKYLKELPRKPRNECEYYSEGDLTQNGYIGCKKHGSIEASIINENKEIEEKKKTLKYKLTNTFPNLDNSLKHFSDTIMGYYTRIINRLPFGDTIVLYLSFVIYCMFGFTIQMTNMPYLIFSLISLFIVIFQYLLTYINTTNSSNFVKNK